MANAFGSITIVDMTDVGQFTTVPMSNAGIVMIYDPNAMSNNYTPSSMTLTPFTTYGGVDYTSHRGVTYSWYRRADGASINYTNPGTPTSTSSSVTVSSSDFTTLSAKSITYYLKATYPITGVGNVTAWGQISISLVTQATNIRDIEINGEHIFKYKYTDYNVAPTIDGASTITLTATYTSNIAVYGWYYYNYSTSQYVSLSGVTGVTIDGNTCTITHTSPIFANNKAKIKVTARRSDETGPSYTELTGVYDEYEIIKLFDGPVGAPGDVSVSIVVSNEDQMIPCDGQGEPTDHAFDLATTTVKVLEGSSNVTTNNISTGYRITANLTGVTTTNGMQYDSNNQLYNFAVTGWGENNDSEQGYVTFEATRTGYPTLTKVMSLTKIKTGQDGVSPTVYQLSITPNSVTTNATGTTTADVVLTASVVATQDTTVTNATTTANLYYEWIKSGVKDTTNSGVNQNTYTVGQDLQVSDVICKIRKNSDSGVVLDSQTVDFIPEGAKGDTGATGDGVISLSFPQSVDTIGLKTDGTLAAEYSVNLPYSVYQGSRRLSAQASGTGQTYSINGVTPTFTWGETQVTITVAKGTKLYDASKTGTSADSLNGQFIIPINYRGATQTAADGTSTSVNGTINATFTWNLDVAPANGSSVTISDTWTRYRLTKTNTQPGTGSVSDITKTGDATTIEGAISAASTADKVKPYYIWSKTFTQYSPSGTASSYTVTFYPADPENGKSVTTTTNKTYACVSASVANAGINPPSSGWNADKATAIGSTAKPYYVWERNIVSYKYSDNNQAGPDTTTYSVSYYPADTVELTLQANATIFNGVIQTIRISPIVTKNGAEYVPTAAELVWSYMLNGQKIIVDSTLTSDDIYRVDSSNAHNLVVTADAINGSTSIQCKLETSGRTVYAYLPLTDDTDEFRCEPYSTIGEALINGQGSGFVECILYRNGYEIDKITAGPTVTSARVPSGTPRAAEISVTTEMDADPKPDNIKDISTIDYSWDYYYADANGDLQEITDNTYNRSGKAVYIDGSMIDKKIVIGCTVDVTYIIQPSS